MKNELQIYRISLDKYSRQRVENAEFNTLKLEEVNSTNYPNLARILDARNGARRYRLKKILEYLARPEEHSFSTGIEEDERSFTDIPIKELMGRYKGSPQTYAKVLNLCCVCGLIVKHNPNRNDQDHNTWLDTEARIYAGKQRNKRKITRRKYYSARVYYHMPKWTAELLQIAEERAQANTGTLTTVIDTYGEDHAQTALDTDRNIPHDTQRARERIDAHIAKALAEKGYTTKSEIMKSIHVLTTRELIRRRKIREGKHIKPYNGRKTVDIDPILTAYMPELCRKYNLRYGAPTRELIQRLRDQYGADRIQIRGKAWIITEKDNAPEDAPTSADGGADQNNLS